MSSWRRVFPATWRKKGSRRIGCLSSPCCLCLDSSSILASFAESALRGKVILSPRGWQYCNDPARCSCSVVGSASGAPPLFLHSIARATSKEELEGWYTKPSADQPYCRVITSVNSCLRGLAGLVGGIVHLCSPPSPSPSPLPVLALAFCWVSGYGVDMLDFLSFWRSFFRSFVLCSFFLSLFFFFHFFRYLLYFHSLFRFLFDFRSLVICVFRFVFPSFVRFFSIIPFLSFYLSFFRPFFFSFGQRCT